MQDILGSIETGKLADIVDDPLKDPQAFGRVVFVGKEDVVYKGLKPLYTESIS